MTFDLVYRQDFDRCLNKKQWKQVEHFRRLMRRMTEQSLSEFDWNGYARNMLIYGHAEYIIEDGKMKLVKH